MCVKGGEVCKKKEEMSEKGDEICGKECRDEKEGGGMRDRIYDKCMFIVWLRTDWKCEDTIEHAAGCTVMGWRGGLEYGKGCVRKGQEEGGFFA